MNDPGDRDRKSFQEHITGRSEDGRITDGSMPDGRPEAREVDTANRALKEKLARDRADDSPVRQAVSAHPVGVAAGAAAGFAAGAVGGLAAGPVGSLFGALAGAVLGGAMGSSGSTGAGAPEDESHWRAHHGSLEGAAPYDEYRHAYRVGDAAHRHYGAQRRWEDLEPDIEAEWPRLRGESSLPWDRARVAARSAWDDRARSGGAEGTSPASP